MDHTATVHGRFCEKALVSGFADSTLRLRIARTDNKSHVTLNRVIFTDLATDPCHACVPDCSQGCSDNGCGGICPCPAGTGCSRVTGICEGCKCYPGACGPSPCGQCTCSNEQICVEGKCEPCPGILEYCPTTKGCVLPGKCVTIKKWQ